MVALKHLKRSNMFRSIFRSSSGSSSILVMLPHHQNWPFTVLISDFNKEQYELTEDDLKMNRNMLERFKCFNATILD